MSRKAGNTFAGCFVLVFVIAFLVGLVAVPYAVAGELNDLLEEIPKILEGDQDN